MTELFLRIVNTSISAGWVVLAVLLLRLCLKRAPKWASVLLWGIVAVRMVFPFSIESVLSLIPSAETISPTIMMEQTPSVQTGVPALNHVINPVISGSFTPAPGASANPLQIWIPVLTGLWLFGIAALFLYSAASYWRLRRKVCEAVILRGNIYQSENVCSPFVLGVIKPKIYLPYHMDSREMDYVIAHEQTHIRRRDHWWKPLGFLLLTIHWFNPLMWLSYILLCRDIELACDEKVIRGMGNAQRADYTQALVACSISRRSIAACPLAFGEAGVKERVKSVMHYKKPAFWIVLASVVICAVVAVCFLTDPVGFRFDADATPIVSANHFDMRNADEPVVTEMNQAQIEELSSRLAGLKSSRRSDRFAGLTPGYQISARLQDGSYIRISGYNLSDDTMVDVEQGGKRYAVSDREFQEYEVFLDKKAHQFLTYDHLEKKWRDAKLDRLNWPGRNYYATCWASEKDAAVVQDYLCGERGGDLGILDFQRNVRDEQLEQRHKRITSAWDQDLAQVPELPKDWTRWIDKVAVRENFIFYRYKRGGAPNGYCTFCGKEVPISGHPYHNKKGRCACCRHPIVFKALGRAGYIRTEKDYAYLIQRCKDGFVLREFWAERTYWKDSLPSGEPYWHEFRRSIYDRSGEIRSYYWGVYCQRETRWIAGSPCYYGYFI